MAFKSREVPRIVDAAKRVNYARVAIASLEPLDLEARAACSGLGSEGMLVLAELFDRLELVAGEEPEAGLEGLPLQLVWRGTQASYELLSTAKGLEKDAPILLWKLKIQQARFVSWGQYFGAGSGVLDAQLGDNGLFDLVVGLLQQTKQMLSHADTLATNHIHSAVLRETRNASQVESVNAACRELKESSSSSSRNVALLYDRIQTSAQAKLAMMSPEDKAMDMSQRRSRTQIETFKARITSELWTTGRYRIHEKDSNGQEFIDDIRILIEWKEFDPKNPVRALIDRRVNRIAELLSTKTPKPTDFRVQDCLGFFEDDEFPRYGMIYRLPQSASREVVSLYNLLDRSEDPLLPDLGDKFKLAKILVTALLRLHDCGWVHGSFRSNNIIFLADEDESEARHLRDPYIHGFTFSRPTDPSEITLEYSMTHFEHDLYRHPQIAQFISRKVLRDITDHQRFQTVHDLYALGIILLEIGLWRRINTLWKDKYTLARFHEKLVTAYVPRLGPKMGITYRDAVQRLLTLPVMQETGRDAASDGAEQDSDTVLDDHREALVPEILLPSDNTELYWEIVAKLSECKV
ncbi:uncharacterized protein LY89DRAFT_721898 [Mollisia scopiformis]|uniref:Uncharacterized protein n=1 Tax=Mollisia scopiformis TaxID=149040 RepID=A0A194WYV7_MOLSC|nr:uncharacterized protein LY89DRAFT_721898 [Mollisia scopiformis]KUJ13130.1 hypothetical protein LY89DRAFT_721898 [Mollisia scopiformis]